MTDIGPCSLCGSTRSIRFPRGPQQNVYCDNVKGCADRRFGTKKPRIKRYPLPLEAVGAFAAASRWAKELSRNGIRQPHGIGPNQTPTKRQRSNLNTIVYAIEELIR